MRHIFKLQIYAFFLRKGHAGRPKTLQGVLKYDKLTIIGHLFGNMMCKYVLFYTFAGPWILEHVRCIDVVPRQIAPPRNFIEPKCS